jgi:hypothetical protein
LTVLLLLWQWAPVYGITPSDSVKVETKAGHESSLAQSTGNLADVGVRYSPKCDVADSIGVKYCAGHHEAGTQTLSLHPTIAASADVGVVEVVVIVVVVLLVLGVVGLVIR